MTDVEREEAEHIGIKSQSRSCSYVIALWHALVFHGLPLTVLICDANISWHCVTIHIFWHTHLNQDLLQSYIYLFKSCIHLNLLWDGYEYQQRQEKLPSISLWFGCPNLYYTNYQVCKKVLIHEELQGVTRTLRMLCLLNNFVSFYCWFYNDKSDVIRN